MKHLSQQMLSEEMRRPHLRRFRRRLQRALAFPGLSADQKRVMQRDLNNLGDPKVYDADDPPPVGSIQGGSRSAITLDLDGATYEKLASVPHTTLYLYALQQDLEVLPGDTKAQVVKTILGSQGEEP